MTDNFYLKRAAAKLILGRIELENSKDVLPPDLYELLSDMYDDAARTWGVMNRLSEDQ